MKLRPVLQKDKQSQQTFSQIKGKKKSTKVKTEKKEEI